MSAVIGGMPETLGGGLAEAFTTARLFYTLKYPLTRTSAHILSTRIPHATIALRSREHGLRSPYMTFRACFPM